MSEILVNTIKKADGTGSLTVPAETGTVLTSASTLSSSNLSGALPALDGSSLTGVGITEVDTWVLNTNFTGNNDSVTNVTKKYSIGTGMSESSGLWTFPSTGVYYIEFHIQTRITDNSDPNWVAAIIRTSTNGGGSFSSLAIGESFLYTWESASTYMKTMTSGFFTVSNTSTHKVQFGVNVDGGNTNLQTDSSGSNYTFMNFIRLGDAP